MHCVIFDIDGTLVQTHAREADCFIAAMTEATGISRITKDLSQYEHVTDSGIARQCFQSHFHRSPSDQELVAIESIFLQKFSHALKETPMVPIPGVHGLFDALTQQKDTAIAIATGSYFRSGQLKLSQAGLGLAHLPLASCDRHYARIEIMQYAADQLKKTYNVSKFDSIVYVGDGPWDITAVKKLGWGFIGIASGYSAAQLMAWGAKSVVKDYLALNDFFIQLDAARRLFLAD